MNYDKIKYYYDRSNDNMLEIIKTEGAKDFFDKVYSTQGHDLMNVIRTFYEENRRPLRNIGIDHLRGMEYSILLEVSRKYIETHQESTIKEILVYDFTKEVFRKNFIDLQGSSKRSKCEEEVLGRLKDFFTEAEKLIPQKLKFYSLFIEKEHDETKYFKDYMYEHFLFNENFKINALNIYMTPYFFSNKRVITYFSELIKCTNPLYYLSLIVNPVTKTNQKQENYNLDSNMYGCLNHIIERVLENETIKFFSFSIDGSNKIVVPPEMSNNFIEIIKKDKLFGLYLGKWVFSKNFYQELFEVLNKLKNLKLFIININSADKKFKERFNNFVHGNKSINVIFYCGVEYEEDSDFETLKINVNRNPFLASFYYSPEIKSIESVRGNEDGEIISSHENKGKYLTPSF